MNLLDDSQRILVEHYEDDFEPTEEELLEYCNMLGLDPSTEQDLLFIAREGIRAPLPEAWKPVEDKSGNIYYFNFRTGQSIWEHPCDEFYKNLLGQERQKKAVVSAKHGSKKRHNAGKKLHGKKTVGGYKGLTNGKLSAVKGEQHHMPPSGALGKKELGMEVNGSLFGRPSGLGDPFSKPLGNGSLALGGSLLAPLDNSGSGGPGKLGNVDLGAINISNQYEEENSETQSEDESDLEPNSAEDVSKELRRVMDLDESNTTESSEEDLSFKHPTLVPPNITSHKSPAVNKLHTPKTASGELRPVTRGHSRGDASGGGGGRGGRGGSSETPFQAVQLHALSVVSGSQLPLSREVTSGGSGRSSQQRKRVVSVRAEELTTKHEASLTEMLSSHEQQLEIMRQRMNEELHVLEESLNHEKKMKIAELRMKLSLEQIAEDKELKEKKKLHLCVLQAKLKEEEEEEEARQMEKKQDTLRKIRNQVEAELEKEKKEIESSRQGNSASFRKKLDEKLKEEEDKVWDALQGELVQLREKLKQDVEEKKKALELAHEKELDVVKTNTKEDQDRLMKDLRKASKDEVDLLKSQLDAERDKLLKEARVETEKKFNTEEMKAKIEESFKVTEAEMEERFGVELEDKKSELSLQHKTELDTLKEEFRRKLDQINEEAEQEMKAKQDKLINDLNDSRNVIILEHESGLQKLREGLQVITRQIEQEKLDQDGVLEAMQSGNEIKKAELVRKLAEHAQQVAGVEERMRRLRDKERELQTDEERLSQLKSANAQETEGLLKRQASHLKTSVETEKKTLEGLNKSRAALESELLKLREYKSDLESSVEQLQQDESDHQLRVERLAEEIKLHQFEASSTLNKTTRGLYKSHQATRLSRQTELNGTPSPPPQLLQVTEWGDGAASTKRGNADLAECSTASGDDDYEEQDPSTAMRLQDLEDGTHDKMTNWEELESAKIRLDRRHREMHEALEDEKRSLNKRREYFYEKERSLKKRQADYKQAHVKSCRGRQQQQQQLHNDGNVTLMTDLQCKLDQEAEALTELEKKVKASNDLLDRKERGLTLLQAFSGKEADAFHHSDVRPPPPRPPSISPTAIGMQISKLSSAFSSLERSRHNCPPHEVTFHRPSFKTPGGEEYELTSSESDSSRPDAVREQHRHLSTPPPSHVTSQASHPSTFHTGSPMRMVVTEPRPLQQQEYAWREDSRIHLPPNKIVQQASTNSIMETLVSINTQVAELMNQVKTSRTGGSCAGNQSVPSPPDNSLVPSVTEPVGVLPLTNTGMRWAHPRMPSKVDLPPEMEEKKILPCDMGGHQSALRMPFGVCNFSATTARSSTEALIKRQTDWLKEFKQNVPHSSQLKPRSIVTFAPSTPAPPLPASISASSEAVRESSELGHLKFTGKPKLILDSRDKIQLIHVPPTH